VHTDQLYADSLPHRRSHVRYRYAPTTILLIIISIATLDDPVPGPNFTIGVAILISVILQCHHIPEFTWLE